MIEDNKTELRSKVWLKQQQMGYGISSFHLQNSAIKIASLNKSPLF